MGDPKAANLKKPDSAEMMDFSRLHGWSTLFLIFFSLRVLAPAADSCLHAVSTNLHTHGREEWLEY